MSSVSTYSRALVSKPLGGLNDTLCQIQRAVTFAEKSGRYLFLDTTESGILAPFDDFFEFVGSPPPVTFGFPESEMTRWNHMTVSPPVLEGRVSEFFERGFPERFSMVGESTNRAVRLPPEDVESDIVIHHQRGGGRLSLRLLNRIRLNPDVAHEVQAMVSGLPDRYAAIHIRATDYTTNYQSVLQLLAKKERHLPIVVCSDNPNVLSDAKELLGDARVFHFSTSSEVSAGAPLHDAANYQSSEQKRQATLELLRDVLAMTGATVFYFTPIEQKGKFGQVTFSGLTMLVRYLQQNPDIRAKFFSTKDTSAHGSFPTEVLLTDWSTKFRLMWERQVLKARRRRG